MSIQTIIPCIQNHSWISFPDFLRVVLLEKLLSERIKEYTGEALAVKVLSIGIWQSALITASGFVLLAKG